MAISLQQFLRRRARERSTTIPLMYFVLVAVLIFLLYANPFLILALWASQLRAHAAVRQRWRTVMSWLSLGLATIGLASFWIVGFKSRYPHPPSGALLFWLVLSLFCAAVGTVTGLLGEGKVSKLPAVSSFIVLLNWLMWATFQ